MTGEAVARVPPEGRRGAAEEPPWPGILLIAFSSLSYGSTPVFARLGFDGGTTPLTLLALRYVIPVAALAVALPMLGRRFTLAGTHPYAGVVIGLLAAAMSYFYLAAIEFVPVSVAVLVFFTYPALAVLGARVLGLGRVGWLKGLATLAAFVGLAFGLDVETGTALDSRGVALAGLGALAYAAMLLYSGRAARGADGLVLAFQSFVVAALVVAPAGLLAGGLVLPASGEGWIGLVGNATAFVIGFLAFVLGIGRIEPVRAAALANLEPLVSIAAAVLVLGETLSPSQLAGIALMLAAIAILGR